jgi:beta-glucosidase/6-phospho-beta-glucosidase/beta-galactosidase
MHGFMFATGIENSYPTVAGGLRIDEMEKCGHYQRWRDDLALVRDMRMHYLRWGPAIYRTFSGPGKYDWAWTDDVMAEMKRLDIEPILDLLHFGVPDWIGNFQNTEFPNYFAEYAGAFAQRFPYIQYWTPVNEILITALFSTKYGWWNEMRTDDASFVRATANICRANLLAMNAILKHVPDAVFIQSESSEYTHPSQPDLMQQADFLNERRFLPLDLTYGHDVSAEMYRFLMANGMSDSEYLFFMNQNFKYRCVLGTDYYVTNEHLLRPDGGTCASGEFFGYYVIAEQYFDRYGLPIMHTEKNIAEERGASQWLWKEWNNMLLLRRDGVPIVGFTWYSLTDQMDWDTALREDRHVVNTVGLYDLNRNIREVGVHYRRLIEQWRGFLPTGSSVLMLV